MVARAQRGARAARERAIGEPLRRRAVDLAASLCIVCATLLNDVAESTAPARKSNVCAVHARARKRGARVGCASVRLASVA
eukprot:5643143-Lingulodinium_polyedra.AAC.1